MPTHVSTHMPIHMSIHRLDGAKYQLGIGLLYELALDLVPLKLCGRESKALPKLMYGCMVGKMTKKFSQFDQERAHVYTHVYTHVYAHVYTCVYTLASTRRRRCTLC